MLIKNIIWDFFGKAANQVVSLFISAILSRLLLPEIFGELGIVLALVGIVQIFSSLGFGNSLIYEKQVTIQQSSTVFFLNTGLGLLLCLLMMSLSSTIADFYEHDSLRNYLIWTSPMFVINGMTVVPSAFVAKEIKFKKMALFSVVSNICSGTMAVILAFNNWGIYSLIAQQLLQTALNFTGSVIISQWWPKFTFSLRSISAFWTYTRPLFFSGLLETVFTRIDSLIIGKIFSFNVLGFYTRTLTLNSIIVQYSSSSLSAVFFPYLNQQKEDHELVKKVYYEFLSVISFLAFGLIIVLYPLSDLIFTVLFGNIWIEASTYFKILVFSSYAYPLSTIMVSVLLIKGATGTFLKLEIFKKIVMLIAYVIGFNFGIYGFLWSINVAYFIAVLLNIYFASIQINDDVKAPLKMLFQYIIICFSVLLCVDKIGEYVFANNEIIKSIIQCVLSFILYIVINSLLKLDGWVLLLEKLRNYKK